MLDLKGHSEDAVSTKQHEATTMVMMDVQESVKNILDLTTEYKVGFVLTEDCLACDHKQMCAEQRTNRGCSPGSCPRNTSRAGF